MHKKRILRTLCLQVGFLCMFLLFEYTALHWSWYILNKAYWLAENSFCRLFFLLVDTKSANLVGFCSLLLDFRAMGPFVFGCWEAWECMRDFYWKKF